MERAVMKDKLTWIGLLKYDFDVIPWLHIRGNKKWRQQNTFLGNQSGHQTANIANVCSSYSLAHENFFSAPLSYFRWTSDITKEIGYRLWLPWAQ